MTEAYKYRNCLLPQTMNDIFRLRKTTYRVRNPNLFESQNPKTKRYGLYCIAYIVSQIWKTISIVIRDSISLKTFKFISKKSL